MDTAHSTSAVASEEKVSIPCLIPSSQLAERGAELAREISRDYAAQSPVVVGVLQGAFVFMADLLRRLTIPVRCDFVKISSYGDEMATSGTVKLQLDLAGSVEGRHILLVDDIVDTGFSTSWLIDHLSRRDPAGIRLCALLDKPARRRVPVDINYIGFEIPDKFVVGYGIDWAGRYRELPYVGYVPADQQS